MKVTFLWAGLSFYLLSFHKPSFCVEKNILSRSFTTVSHFIKSLYYKKTVTQRKTLYFGGRERGCVGDSVGRLVIISIVQKGHKEKPEHSNGDYSRALFSNQGFVYLVCWKSLRFEIDQLLKSSIMSFFTSYACHRRFGFVFEVLIVWH